MTSSRDDVRSEFLFGPLPEYSAESYLLVSKGVPVPDLRIVRTDADAFEVVLDGRIVFPDFTLDELEKAAHLVLYVSAHAAGFTGPGPDCRRRNPYRCTLRRL